MRSIAIFVEDYGHQVVLNVLIQRIAAEFGRNITLVWGNTRDGHGAVVRELKQFLRDLQRGSGSFPDLIIVATDGNCKGFVARRKEITGVTDQIPAQVICAIPDPHIERWLMIDSAAFKAVFGHGCSAPDQKCNRDRYKHLLVQAILKTGFVPNLGGIEFAEEIVAAIDLSRAALLDPSLSRFLDDLRAAFKQWQN